MIGDRIKSLRRVRKLTLKQLADQTGVSEGHMSKIENDKTQPSVAVLHRITQSLDVTIGLLFNETDSHDQPVSRAGERPVIDLDPVRRALAAQGLESEVVTVDYESQKGANRMLRLGANAGGTVS